MRRLLLLLAVLGLSTPALADEAPRFLVVRVDGMDCAGCNKTVGEALEKLPFLQGVHASFAAPGACGTLTGPVDEAALASALTGTAYTVGSIEVVSSCPEGLRGTLPQPWDGKTDGLDVATISHGEPVDLAPHLAAGKYTVIDFGASWCGPCHEAADAIAAYLAEHDDVAVRAIELAGATAQESYEQPVVAQHLTYVSGIPWLLVYAPDGKIISKSQSVSKTLSAVDKHRAKQGRGR
jgi:thiol-disulfide isomerase/thioredoxin/copper chaperone CopZ